MKMAKREAAFRRSIHTADINMSGKFIVVVFFQMSTIADITLKRSLLC